MKEVFDGSEDPLTVLVACEIEAVSDSDIIAWANTHLASAVYADDIDYLLLVRSNRLNAYDVACARERLRALVVRKFPDFSLKSKVAEAKARLVFLRCIRAYLDSEQQPFLVCRMLGPAEDLFGVPDWMHGFYDACDYIDERTPRRHAGHLAEGIARILATHGQHTEGLD